MFISRALLPGLVAALSLLLPVRSSLAEGDATGAGSWQHTPLKVLMVGDSLSVDTFGENIEAYLLSKFGHNGFALYASCGSSPENWLHDEHDYITRCGFRYASPLGNGYFDFVNGQPPRRVLTPKIEALMAGYRPSVVVVQLGTNWMDPIVEHGANDSHYRAIVDRFVAAIRSRPDSGRQIIWITPPDHSRYSAAVKRDVSDLLAAEAKARDFDIIDSSKMTHYIPGVTGGDGIHYHSKDAKDWAVHVIAELDKQLHARTVAASH